jgi:hypothetical protein
MSLNESRKKRASKLAQEVAAQIETELGFPVDERGGSVSDELLSQMLRLVLELKVNIDEDNIPQKQLRHKTLQRIIVDSWPWGTELGKRVNELEELYLALD